MTTPPTVTNTDDTFTNTEHDSIPERFCENLSESICESICGLNKGMERECKGICKYTDDVIFGLPDDNIDCINDDLLLDVSIINSVYHIYPHDIQILLEKVNQAMLTVNTLFSIDHFVYTKHMKSVKFIISEMQIKKNTPLDNILTEDEAVKLTNYITYTRKANNNIRKMAKRQIKNLYTRSTKTRSSMRLQTQSLRLIKPSDTTTLFSAIITNTNTNTTTNNTTNTNITANITANITENIIENITENITENTYSTENTENPNMYDIENQLYGINQNISVSDLYSIMNSTDRIIVFLRTQLSLYIQELERERMKTKTQF